MRRSSWLVGIGVAVLIAAVVRFYHLSVPNQYLFDEDLHAFTAHLVLTGDARVFEWWHPPFTLYQSAYTYRAPAIEWLHPPLPKYLMAVAIAVAGDQPVAWRLPVAVAGVSLVMGMAVLAYLLFASKAVALIATLLGAGEHLLIVQSRIASADMFVASFVIWGITCFVLGVKRSVYWMVPAGVLFGLALSSKWSGALSVLGVIPLLLLAVACRRSKRFRTQTQRLLPALKSRRALFSSLAMLIILPIAVYILSYSPALWLGKTPSDLWQLQLQAWQYHTTNRATHPASSPAYLWPVGQKVVPYAYASSTTPNITARLSWWTVWGGLAALLLSISVLLTQNTRRAKQSSWLQVNLSDAVGLLLLVWLYAWNFLPWLLVSRPLFLYHYLVCVPLILIMLSYWLVKIGNLTVKRLAVRSAAPHHPSK